MRKRKRRYRRRTMMRARRFYRRRRRRSNVGNSPEIKVCRLVDQNQALRLSVQSSVTFSLWGTQFYASNILKNILLGTQSNQRIGSKIYVMGIGVHTAIWACTGAETTYNVGNFTVRHIWHNSGLAAGTNITDFFANSMYKNHISYPDRKEYTIHKDFTTQIVASGYTYANTTQDSTIGPYKQLKYYIPVNRYVTFTADGIPREDRNIYSYSAITATSGITSTTYDARQIGCFDNIVTIYYKDA